MLVYPMMSLTSPEEFTFFGRYQADSTIVGVTFCMVSFSRDRTQQINTIERPLFQISAGRSQRLGAVWQLTSSSPHPKSLLYPHRDLYTLSLKLRSQSNLEPPHTPTTRISVTESFTTRPQDVWPRSHGPLSTLPANRPKPTRQPCLQNHH